MADEIDVEAELADQRRIAQVIDDMGPLTSNGPATEQYRESDWRVRLDLLESYWEDFKRNDIMLQRYEQDLADRSYFKAQKFVVTLNQYFSVKAFISNKLQDSRQSSSSPSYTTAVPRSPQTSLEPVKLPKFHGLQRDWESFKEQFTALVIDDGSMAKVVKFQRLLNCLGEQPMRAVQGIKVIGDNFVTAWEALCGKYDNKPLRFLMQMQVLQEMPASNQESAAHLQTLLTTIDESIINFAELGRKVEHWDDILNFFITSKFAERTRLDWIKYINTEKLGDFPAYSQLKEFLKLCIRSLELAHPPNEIQSSRHLYTTRQDSSKYKLDRPRNKMSTTVSYYSGKIKGKIKRPFKCSFCQEAHFINFCSKFQELSISDKRLFIQNHKLCINCLNAHSIDKCFSEGRCGKCGEKHHTKIHELYSSSNNSPPAANSAIIDNNNRTSSSMQLSNVFVSTAQLLENSDSSTSLFIRRRTFLATAILTFRSPQGHQMKVRALLDTGSEDSFFSEHMVQSLSLHKQQTSVVCYGVGERTTSIANSFCSAHLYSSSFPELSLRVSALVLKRVAGNSPSKFISTST